MSFGPLLLAGQVVGIAFASGLNLYATITLLGLASRLEIITGLPPELRGLEHPLLIGSAALLYAIEFIIDKIPHVNSLWDAIHTFVRPTAAALLALGAASAFPLQVQLAGALLAGTVALAAHGTKAGLRLAIHASRWRRAGTTLSVAEDAAAIALAVAVLRYPAAAASLAAASLLLVGLVGPLLWRAFLLGLRALAARVHGFFENADWHDINAIPAELRALLPTQEPGLAPHRAARAAVRGLRGVGAFRTGWLVVTHQQPFFVYRSLLGARSVPLPPNRAAHLSSGMWADVLELDADRNRYTLFLLKDGPPARAAMLELLSTTAA
jgi:hypothetical protein